MNSSTTKTIFSWFILLSFGLLLSAAVSAGQTASLKNIRTIDTDDLFSEEFFSADNPDLSGVGFPPGASTLLLLNQPTGSASVVLAAPPKDKMSKVSRTPLLIPDSINIAYDSVSTGSEGYGLSRLFLLDADLGELVAIKAGPRNVMDPAKISYFDAQGFGIANPQGMTMDPATGQLFVLDSAGPRIVGIQPKPGREFAGAEVTQIILGGLVGELRGLAFNPSDNHLYVLSTEQQKLYKLTLDGDLVTSLDLSGLQIGVPQGMVFAPSLDSTDYPSIFHLYLVTAQGLAGEVTEWALP